MLNVGQFIGSYRILRILGQGSMGQVYEGVQEEIGKRVAIKALHSHLCQQPEAVNRFLNEARAVNLIKHSSLVTIFEYSKLPDGTVYIVMEYLEGQSLAQRIERGRLSIPESMRLGRQIAAAMQAAHDKNIVHRDLKPDNVIIVPDSEAAAGERAKILDFGIAKLTEEQKVAGARVKTQSGMQLGTPLYMSPEQCDGAVQVDTKSDVYALGVVFYEMLTGSPPFVGNTVSAVMLKHMSAAAQPIRELNPQVPERLADMIHSMLAKAAPDRPTMAEVAKELESLGAQRTVALDAVHDDALPPPSLPDQDRRLRSSGQAPIAPGASGPPARNQAVAAGAPSESSSPSTDSPIPESPPKRRWPVIFVIFIFVSFGGVGGYLALWPQKVRVSVELVGALDSGKVLSEPVGIECGERCTEFFSKSVPIRLTATPAPNHAFAGWSGDCTGTEPCQLPPGRSLRIEARFTRLSPPLQPSQLSAQPVAVPPATPEVEPEPAPLSPPSPSHPRPVHRSHRR